MTIRPSVFSWEHPPRVEVSTRTVGQRFATVGVLTQVGTDNTEECEQIVPYGQEANAFEAAMLLAKHRGFVVVPSADTRAVEARWADQAKAKAAVERCATDPAYRARCHANAAD